MIRCRIKAAGERASVYVTPHCLRHTMATQLLNAGCRVTTTPKLLGHRDLNSTMIYARAHDRTVSADYYTAMASIEKRLNLGPKSGKSGKPRAAKPLPRTRLLKLADGLAQPKLGQKKRLELVDQLRKLLKR